MMDYEYSLFAFSSEGNGRYALISEDTIDGAIDKYDKKLYLQLANACAQFTGFQSRR